MDFRMNPDAPPVVSVGMEEVVLPFCMVGSPPSLICITLNMAFRRPSSKLYLIFPL